MTPERRRKSDKWYVSLLPWMAKGALFVFVAALSMQFAITNIQKELSACESTISEHLQSARQVELKVQALETALPYISDQLKSINDQLKDMRRHER